MRILQVIHDFVPETLAGAEINTHKLSVDLTARGHDVYVFCRGWKLDVEPYSIRDELLDGLHVRRVDFGAEGKAHRATRHNPLIDQAFRNYLAEVQPDLIHFQHFIYLTSDLVTLAKECDVPVVISLRNFWFRCPWGNRLYHDDSLCDRYADLECLSCLWPDYLSRKRKVIPWRIINPILVGGYRAGLGGFIPLQSEPRQILDSLSNWVQEFRDALLKADIIHTPSKFLGDMVIDFGIPADRVIVIENGIRYDTSQVHPKTPSPHLRFGLIGVSAHKGAHVAVQAMRHLPPGAAELRLYGQVADQRYLSHLETLAQGANVRFMGSFSQSNMYQTFSEVDALIVPSIWYENCPTVIREAFATGTPVITCGIGGMAESVRDGVDGFHFAVGDPVDLAAKLQCLIDNPALLAEFGANIKLPPTAEAVSDQIEKIYHHLWQTKTQVVVAEQEKPPQVSIIIPAYNEEKYISVCLNSLAKQEGVTVEVIVVDDGSTDSTVQIVQSFIERDSRFHLLRQNHQGPGEARNLAARQAQGDILLFCDADMAFAPDYTRKLIAPIGRGECLGTFSKEEYVLNFDNIWARSWNLHDGMYNDKRHPDNWPDEQQVFRAVDKKAFLAAGGFSTKGSGDDVTLASKLGQMARVAPGAICYHHNPDSPGEVFRQARWYARGMRIPLNWKNFILHTPPFSIARSFKRAVRFHNPMFPVFKLVHDLGILSGMTNRLLARSRHGR
ncbi:MAG: glycosyltransferase [Chloroflexi bacterium]|nr:glycosyltransferase [Chloroflexota bacterium]